MKMINLNAITTTDGLRFFYTDIGSELHGWRSFRLWVHPTLVTKDGDKYWLPVPKQGISLAPGAKQGNWVLRPGDANLFYVYVRPGFRGESTVEVLTPNCIVVPFEIYQSPRGNLGVGRGALVATPMDHVDFKWTRSGRLYGAPPDGISRITLQGEILDTPEAPPDLAEML